MQFIGGVVVGCLKKRNNMYNKKQNFNKKFLKKKDICPNCGQKFKKDETNSSLCKKCRPF